MKNIILTSLLSTVLTIFFISLFSFKLSDTNTDNNITAEMPVGTIIAYAGEKRDLRNKGWLICNGSSYFKNDYPELYSVIKNMWGPSYSNGNDFQIPNLEGQFLRGAENGNSHTNRTFDKSPRYRVPGSIQSTNSGDIVGTYQKDYFKAHNHGGGGHNHGGKIKHRHRYKDIFMNEHRPFSDMTERTNYKYGDGGSDRDNGYMHFIYRYTDERDIVLRKDGFISKEGFLETVPKNVAVHYYIKYR